ncbi:MAG: flagellar hook-length control protein FliK [Firmicutes bacterium]|nr:flagellar hook-length control protein FliK [Bacillota bacterium]
MTRAIALAQQRDGEVRLRLSPPELGTLRIELRVQEGVLLVQLHAETEAARSAILDQLPVLRERLADQGIQLERFDVDLLPRHGGHGHDHSGGQPRDWPLPPRTLGPLAAASSQPRPGTLPASPRPPASSAGGLDVLV